MRVEPDWISDVVQADSLKSDSCYWLEFRLIIMPELHKKTKSEIERELWQILVIEIFSGKYTPFTITLIGSSFLE